MWLMLDSGKHVYDAFACCKLSTLLEKQDSFLPERCEKAWIPIMFLKTPAIDRVNPTINTVDRKLIWSHPDNRSVFLMRRKCSPVVLHIVSSPDDPCFREWSCGMGVG